MGQVILANCVLHMYMYVSKLTVGTSAVEVEVRIGLYIRVM